MEIKIHWLDKALDSDGDRIRMHGVLLGVLHRPPNDTVLAVARLDGCIVTIPAIDATWSRRVG